jgi:hypothetical protein
MRLLSAAAVMVLLTAPAYAQTPNVNLFPEVRTKTPEEKERDAVRDRAYKDSLRKIPDAKASNDPWGTVRGSGDAKAANKPSAASTTAHAKRKAKAGRSARQSQ